MLKSVCMSEIIDGMRLQDFYLQLVLCADIEELTSKTGNFKQFAVFLNMLESAITKVNRCSGWVTSFPANYM